MCILCEAATLKVLEDFHEDLTKLNRNSVRIVLKENDAKPTQSIEDEIYQQLVHKLLTAVLEAAENLDKLQVAPPNNIENN